MKTLSLAICGKSQITIMKNFKIGSLYDNAFKDMSKDEIKDNLEAIAYSVEEKSYTKNLTEEELNERKDEYSSVGIQLSELNESKKEILDSFKLKMKQPQERANELISSIKFKSEQRYGELFLVDDQNDGLMYSFDSQGICVDARPLTKKEKQLKLKTAT